jgi:dTDP-glucose pyrophosphorylase
MNNLIRKVPENRIVKNTDSILSVLKLMDATLRKLYIVCDNIGSYIGLVSMGDIQRAIIRNIALNESIGNILRKENRVASLGDSFSEIKQLMIEFRMEFMPVLNEEKQIIGIYLWEDLFPGVVKTSKKSINLPVVIMAGGQGSRLKPLTNILPKPLIPIGEKSIIETIMDSFYEYGCEDFYISLNYKADFTQDYINKYINQENKFRTHFFIETKPLGTAGSLHLLKDKIQSTFFISNCDIIIEQDYTEILNYHKQNKNELTVVAALRHYRIPYGTIESGESGELQQLNEKPELTFKINSGLYILEPHLLAEIPTNEFFHITELIEKIIGRKGKVGVFPVPEGAWKDIGEWEEYLKYYKQ